MNRDDPLDQMEMSSASEDIPPAPKPIEFGFPLVSQRSREDFEQFGPNMVRDYHDFKEEVLTWLGNYGKNPFFEIRLAGRPYPGATTNLAYCYVCRTN